jgi:hypothetical protein
LAYVLTQGRFVRLARQVDRCLLCRSEHVNEAGLCMTCTAMIDRPDELKLLHAWFEGRMP